MLDVLLSHNVYPFSTEYFTISTNGFKDIKPLIDDSDYFILLLSDRYGTEFDQSDDTSISWTELEARYAFANAKANGQKIIVFQLPAPTKMMGRTPAMIKRKQARQIRFAKSLSGEAVHAVKTLEICAINLDVLSIKRSKTTTHLDGLEECRAMVFPAFLLIGSYTRFIYQGIYPATFA